MADKEITQNATDGEETAFEFDTKSYGIETRAVPKPKKSIDIDTDGEFLDNILKAGESSQIDISKIESFSQVSQNRDQTYALLDTMAEDSTTSAILETYAEDATETNDEGNIVWAESSDEYVQKYITYLLNTMNVDKNIYKWVYALCKYGDVYLRLYRESEFNDSLFDDEPEDSASNNTRKYLNEASKKIEDDKEKEALNEDVVLKVYNNGDRLVHYLEMVPNPAEMFELTKFGKTYAYIKANITNNQSKKKDSLINNTSYYAFKKKDVSIFDATNFVHAALEDNSSRVPEEVSIFLPKNGEYNMSEENSLTYTVRRGQSLLYNSFKIWRELMLLENSLLLNRITKSSILRVIGVEVADMPKENVGPHLQSIKSLIEQKSAVDTGNSFSEYTNPGPMENNIYVPTHGGVGAITMQTIGGDVNVTGLSDIDYFKNKFFGGLRVPKQYFGETDDSTGFNGGTSLSLISSRYAKMVKRIQNTILQALTDAINIMLLDKGLDSYINKFDLHMLPPTTTEEKDRRENMSNRINTVSDIMNLIDGIEDQSAKLRIMKILISGVVNDSEILTILQEQIESLEKLEEGGTDTTPEEGTDGDMPISHSGIHRAGGVPRPSVDMERPPMTDSGNEDEGPDTEGPSGEQVLPTPADLGAGDFTDNNNPELEA